MIAGILVAVVMACIAGIFAHAMQAPPGVVGIIATAVAMFFLLIVASWERR